MAKPGINHPNASVGFEFVELARDMREYESIKPTVIQRVLHEACQLPVSINTLNDWLYYRTRLNA